MDCRGKVHEKGLGMGMVGGIFVPLSPKDFGGQGLLELLAGGRRHSEEA